MIRKARTALTFTLIILFNLSPVVLFAQPGHPKVPIDGGIGILIAAGALLGVKKLFGSGKK
jgi:hypothetical protein